MIGTDGGVIDVIETFSWVEVSVMHPAYDANARYRRRA